ncbi:MAG: hypothetical protein OEZ02_07455 [Anaerolineae bacterium]|nr:hypothetical protein [Anaerolineae bacterium]
MIFPDSALLAFIYWLINTPGLGGLAFITLAATILFSVSMTLRWISAGSAAPEPEQYAYPTTALHMHQD